MVSSPSQLSLDVLSIISSSVVTVVSVVAAVVSVVIAASATDIATAVTSSLGNSGASAGVVTDAAKEELGTEIALFFTGMTGLRLTSKLDDVDGIGRRDGVPLGFFS